MRSRSGLTALLAVGNVHAAAFIPGTCTDFIAQVSATAPIFIFPAPQPGLTLADAKNYLAELLSDAAAAASGGIGNEIQSGDFNISMRYCTPTKLVAKRADTVQVLLHGVSYDKEYWHSEGNADYSWVDYALTQGYPTLSYDDLGVGNSTHANPLFVAQQSMREEVLHQNVLKLRAGTLSNSVPKKSKVIYVGHSHGSVQGNALAVYHPQDADALVLTGFSNSLLDFTTNLLLHFPLPALLQDPTKYSDPQDLLELKWPSKEYRRAIFYTPHILGDYSEDVLQHDFDVSTFFPVMQAITVFYGYGVAPQYTGPVFAMAGQHDAVFCYQPLGSDCGSGDTSKVAQTSRNFPNSQKFGYYIAPRTGHSLNYFHSQQESFKQAHDFLAESGF